MNGHTVNDQTPDPFWRRMRKDLDDCLSVVVKVLTAIRFLFD